jgi:hypothetical protein
MPFLENSRILVTIKGATFSGQTFGLFVFSSLVLQAVSQEHQEEVLVPSWTFGDPPVFSSG